MSQLSYFDIITQIVLSTLSPLYFPPVPLFTTPSIPYLPLSLYSSYLQLSVIDAVGQGEAIGVPV